MPDAGEWRPVGDPAVPAWLEPFGGKVLVAHTASARVAEACGFPDLGWKVISLAPE